MSNIHTYDHTNIEKGMKGSNFQQWRNGDKGYCEGRLWFFTIFEVLTVSWYSSIL